MESSPSTATPPAARAGSASGAPPTSPRAAPVLTQQTGFSDWLETGAGLIAFDTPDDVLAGMTDIDGDYQRHCRAARALAEEFFDARKVLNSLIERALTRPL